MRELLEICRVLIVCGASALAFGVAWVLSASEEWVFYGAMIALVGFCAVILGTLVKIFVVEDQEPPLRIKHGGKLSGKELDEIAEAWRRKFIYPKRRDSYHGIGSTLADEEPL